MGFSENGTDLLYGLRIARPSAPTTYLDLPNIPVSMTWRDRQPVAEHENLAGDLRRSFVKILAPDATIQLDALSESELALWRAFHLNATEFYILEIKSTERILAQDAVVQVDVAGNFFCAVPHSSYTLGSKRSVENGGPTLLSRFRVAQDWKVAMEDTAAPGPGNFFTSYADLTEIATLNAAFAPPAGSRCWVCFSATAWLACPAPGFSWAPVTARSDLHTGSLTFRGA